MLYSGIKSSLFIFNKFVSWYTYFCKICKRIRTINIFRINGFVWIYVIFYETDAELYEQEYKKYEEQKIFNSNDNNIEINGVIFGTSNFSNSRINGFVWIYVITIIVIFSKQISNSKINFLFIINTIYVVLRNWREKFFGVRFLLYEKIERKHYYVYSRNLRHFWENKVFI